MFLSESKLLCDPEYWSKLVKLSRNISAKEREAINAKAEILSQTPVTPKLTIDENNNAHVYIYGALVNDPDPMLVYFGQSFTTYQSIQDSFNRIRESNSDKIYLHIDSPGGMVAGVDNIWKTVIDLREDFEVIAINEGMIASAAYWIASAADRIVSDSETNDQGSIGVICGYCDYSKYDEKAGIEEKIFVSKNAKFKHPSQEGFDETLQKEIDEIEDIFVDRVSIGRGVTADHIYNLFGSGAMLLSKEAKEVGMIDDIIPTSELFLSDQDKPVTGDVNTLVKGDNDEMTLEEMLNDPGVQAKIKEIEAAAKALGRKEALGEVRSVMSFIGSDKYPESVKDAALAFCEGSLPRAALDVLVAHVDKEHAAKASAEAEGDESNQEPLPSRQSTVEPPAAEGPKTRTAEDTVQAVRELEGKV
jgi:ClpP class serine protease